MVTVPHIMVGLERMLDYRGVGLERFVCIIINELEIQMICKLNSPLGLKKHEFPS